MARMMQDYDLKVGNATEFDRLSTEGGLIKRRGRVLFHTNFESGNYEGWRDHFDGTTPRPPLSLTSYPVYNGAHALRISTGEEPYDVDHEANGSGTYKNMTLFRSTGLISFSGYFTVGSGKGSTAWASWGISMDIQKKDSSSRMFPNLTCLAKPDGEPTPVWRIKGDTESAYIDAAAGLGAGQNEGKFNWNYLRLTMDLSANGGLGGYYEAQINDETFDLRGLGAGRGATPPQAGSDQFRTFAGGQNCGIFLGRSTAPAKANVYPSWLVCDELVCTVDDVRA